MVVYQFDEPLGSGMPRQPWRSCANLARPASESGLLAQICQRPRNAAVVTQSMPCGRTLSPTTDLSGLLGERDAGVTRIVTELDDNGTPVTAPAATHPADAIPLGTSPVFIERIEPRRLVPPPAGNVVEWRHEERIDGHPGLSRLQG